MTWEVREINSMRDVEEIIAMADDFHSTHRPELDFEPDKIREHGRQLMADYTRRTYNAFVAIKDNEYVGFLVGTCTPYFFNYSVSASQELLYVKPEYRSLTPLKKLLQVFANWAELNGALEIYTGVSVHELERADRVSNMFSYLGFKKIGYYHMKGLNR